jgi:hypothetical protein
MQKIDVFEKYIDNYMEEVNPAQTKEIIMQGLVWHILTEKGLGSKPFGIIGYRMVTDDNKAFHILIEILYIAKTHRGKTKFWVRKILDFCKKHSNKKVQLQIDTRTTKLIEKLFNKKPSLSIFNLDTDEVGEKYYGWR